jgi:hypothetical protein
MTTEPKYDSDLISKDFTPSDSLEFLEFESVDLGTLKIKSVVTKNIIIRNISEKHDITIYKIENTNKTGIFTYSFPGLLPFEIKTLEVTDLDSKIEVKFIADPIVPAIFYDTLIVNDNPDFYIPIKVRTTF